MSGLKPFKWLIIQNVLTCKPIIKIIDKSLRNSDANSDKAFYEHYLFVSFKFPGTRSMITNSPTVIRTLAAKYLHKNFYQEQLFPTHF